MRAHTQEFKNQIKELGREIDSKITYGDNVITAEQLFSVSPTVNGSILKSAMKELDFESSIQVPINTIIKYEFGLKVADSYEYLDYGNYIVYSSEYNEDTKTYQHTCYDSMLFSMKEYTTLQNGTFPMTIREYITNLCLDCGLIFKNYNDTFANYNKVIESDLYANLQYTYRDIFDELSAVTASTICVDINNMVEARYITQTDDVIDEEYLKDINVKFGEKYGPINSIVLSRSGESDNVYLQDEESVEANGLCEIKIIDNQIMNDNNRSDYLADILLNLNGLEYYINDYSSTGILYYELCDKYIVQTGENTYQCILFNDEPKITQGLVENIFTEKPEESVTDYTKADKTDRKINQVYIIVDKQNQKINAVVENQENQKSTIAELEIEAGTISQRVNDTETTLNDLNEAITTIEGTFLEQTSENFTMWFEQTGVQGTIDDLKELLNNQNTTLDQLRAYIRYGVITDTESEFYGSPYAEFGKEDAQTKLRILDNRIQFLTGETETAYISNNALYINESTILTKQVIGQDGIGKWITEIDEQGNLNTYWGGID